MKRHSWVAGSRTLLVLALTLACLAPRRGLAQGSVTGKILGTIADSSGAVLVGTKVALRNLETNLTRTTETSNLGAYEFLEVPTGSYEVSAEKVGFAKSVSHVQVTVQSALVVNLTLAVGNANQAVTVSDQQEVLNTTDATISGFVNNEKVSDLPLNGRSFVDLIGLEPGATPIMDTSGGRTSNTRNNGGFINGADDFYNDFTIDGGDFNDIVVPGSLINKALIGSGVPPDAIEEFRVITANANAEFGTVAGAHVNVVTKSGTNNFHSTLWEFLRNNAFDARNYFDPSHTLPFKLNQFGAVAGGPIRKDRNFVFASYEGFRQSLDQTITAIVPTPLLLNSMPGGPGYGNLKQLFQAYYPAPNTPVGPTDLTGRFRTHVNANDNRNSFLIRSDNQLTSKDSLSGRIIFNDASGPPGVILSVGIPGGDLGFGWRTIDPQITYTRMISPRTVNEFRVNYNRSRLSVSWDQPPASVVPLGYSQSAGDANGLPFIISVGTGLSWLGEFLGVPEGRVADVFQYNDTLTMTRGRHTLKTGFNIFRYQNNSFGADRPRPQVIFVGFGAPFDNSPFGLTTGTFLQQSQTFNLNPPNNSHRYDRFSLFAGFVQDNFRLTPKLTLDYGIRYELSTIPHEKYGIQDNLYQLNSAGQPLPDQNITDITNVALIKPTKFGFAKVNKLDFAPRVGAAWTPFGGDRIVFRAGYGIFFQRPDLFFFNDGTANPPFSIPTNLQGQLFGTHANPNNFLTQKINANTYDPGNAPTYVQNYNFNLQLRVDANSYIQAGYVGSHTSNINIVAQPNGSGGFAGTRPNPTFGTINLDADQGYSNYNSLQVEFNRKLSRGLSWQSSYTYSKNLGLVEPGTTPTNLNNYRLDYGRMDSDLRHMFITNVLYALPFGPGKSMLTTGLGSKILGGWSLSGIFIAHSGQPFSLLAGVDANNDGNATDRARLLPGASLSQLKNHGGPETQFLRPSTQVLNVIVSPTTGTLTGRNVLDGPGVLNLDFGVQKQIVVTERAHFEFRAELFNIFNHTDLSNPDNTITSPTFGQITSTSLNSRQVQFALKFYY